MGFTQSGKNDQSIIISNFKCLYRFGNCDWQGLVFLSLERKLFNEEHKKLKTYRSNLKGSIIDALKGKWIVSGLSKEMKQNDLLTFVRTDELDGLEEGTTIWTFGDSLLFNSSDNETLDFTYSKNYDLYVNNGSLDLTIASGAVISPNGNMTIENYGAYLTIDEVEKDKIVMNYLRR